MEAEKAGVAAVVLAAGRSTRMGGENKLLATVGDRPMVRIAADAALASSARPVVVVTGHQSESVEAALGGLDTVFAHNPKFADGLATSLRAGLAALPSEIRGAVILLADMPHVDATLIDHLIARFDPAAGASVIVPCVNGKRGNPVLWARCHFADLMSIHGDTGGRPLLRALGDAVTEVPVLGAAALVDVDTEDELSKVLSALNDR